MKFRKVLKLSTSADEATSLTKGPAAIGALAINPIFRMLQEAVYPSSCLCAP